MAKPKGTPYVAEIKRRYKDKVYTTFLVRCSYREDGKVKQQTLANVTHLPPHAIEALRATLQGATLLPLEDRLACVRSRAHGHVAAVRAMLRDLKLHEFVAATPCRERDLVEAMIVARIVNAQTKLSTSRWWHGTTLPEDMGITDATADDLYDAMDWLLERQPHIERQLAKRHLANGDVTLYDVSSSYYEGSHCTLALFGHNRDGKKGKLQVVYGLLTDILGCPVAVAVFSGNTSDPATVEKQLDKIKTQFRLEHVVLAGDRGMLTQARIERLQELGGIDWITALRAPAIKKLAAGGYLQLSLFDQRDLAEITSPDFPGERLVVCRNPFLAQERTRKRDELLSATEGLLEKLVKRVEAGRLKDPGKIGEALGRVINRFKMAKHFLCTIKKGHFSYRRREESIAEERRLDGIYVLRTSVPEQEWSAKDVVRGYKSLANAERAVRTLKSIDLRVRPIHHWIDDRVRAHVFLCMLAYYVEWHLRDAWRPMLFDDEDSGQHVGDSPVLPAVRSEKALKKAHTQRREDGAPVHSLRTLLADLGTVVRNEMRVPARPDMPTFTVTTTPTPLQQEALDRVGCKVSAGRNGRQKTSA